MLKQPVIQHPPEPMQYFLKQAYNHQEKNEIAKAMNCFHMVGTYFFNQAIARKRGTDFEGAFEYLGRVAVYYGCQGEAAQQLVELFHKACFFALSYFAKVVKNSANFSEYVPLADAHLEQATKLPAYFESLVYRAKCYQAFVEEYIAFTEGMTYAQRMIKVRNNYIDSVKKAKGSLAALLLAAHDLSHANNQQEAEALWQQLDKNGLVSGKKTYSMEIKKQNKQLLTMLHTLARRSKTANIALAIVYHFGCLGQSQNNEWVTTYLKTARQLGYPWQISRVTSDTILSDVVVNLGFFTPKENAVVANAETKQQIKLPL